MFLNYLSEPVVSTKTMQDNNGDEFIITDETYGARIDDIFMGEYTRRAFSNTDNVFYIFSSNAYKLLVQKFDWGNSAQLSKRTDDKYFPRIIIDMPLDDSEKPVVSMKTTSYSDDFTIEETRKFADRFNAAAVEMEWITKVINNIDNLD